MRGTEDGRLLMVRIWSGHEKKKQEGGGGVSCEGGTSAFRTGESKSNHFPPREIGASAQMPPTGKRRSGGVRTRARDRSVADKKTRQDNILQAQPLTHLDCHGMMHLTSIKGLAELSVHPNVPQIDRQIWLVAGDRAIKTRPGTCKERRTIPYRVVLSW